MAHEGMHACESHENSVQRALGARAGAPPLPCAVEVCCSRHEPRALACPRAATKGILNRAIWIDFLAAARVAAIWNAPFGAKTDRFSVRRDALRAYARTACQGSPLVRICACVNITTHAVSGAPALGRISSYADAYASPSGRGLTGLLAVALFCGTHPRARDAPPDVPIAGRCEGAVQQELLNA